MVGNDIKDIFDSAHVHGLKKRVLESESTNCELTAISAEYDRDYIEENQRFIYC